METTHTTASYVHVQRVLDLLGTNARGRFRAPSTHIEQGIFFSELSQAFVSWLVAANVRSLGQRLLSGDLKDGDVFTHLGAFYGRGMPAYTEQRTTALPEIYSKLDDFIPGLRLVATINPDHLTTTSARDHVSGHRRLFFVGIVSSTTATRIEARPILLGLVGTSHFGGDIDLGFPEPPTTGEVFPSQIDAFSDAADSHPPTMKELARLRDIPETDIKQAFAEIIGEPFVPRDRADEMSDLVSARLSIRAEPLVGAFAFKGPAKFHPLTVRDMGVNGDQIFRLFNEPADLMVIQHCHQITSAIRAHMRAFATQPGRGRRFCLIDGADTCKILATRGLLGFSSKRRRTS